MSLYGINAYTSNSYYSTLLGSKTSSSSSSSSNSLASLLNQSSSKSKSSNDTFEFLKSIAKTDASSDLMTLAKNIDLVRSKGYGKTMTEEYKKIFSGKATDTTTGDASVVGSKAAELALSKTAKSLGTSAMTLSSGNMSYYNDSEKLLSGVKDYVANYNSTIDALKNSDSALALKKGVSMVSSTAAYSKSLSSIGISVGSDNKLTLDETKFGSANLGNVKSLFSGSYSYASKTAEKANYIDRLAQVQAQTTYNSQGKANSIFDNAMINSMFSKLF